MTISIVQSVFGVTSPATLGVAVGSGHAIVVVVEVGTASVTCTVSDNKGNTYTQDATVNTTGFSTSFVFSSLNVTNGPTIITATPSAGGVQQLGVYELSSSTSSVAVDATHPYTSAFGTALSDPGVTATAGDFAVLTMQDSAGTSLTFTQSTAWTNDLTASDRWIYHLLPSVGGANAFAGTFSASAVGYLLAVTYKAAGSVVASNRIVMLC